MDQRAPKVAKSNQLSTIVRTNTTMHIQQVHGTQYVKQPFTYHIISTNANNNPIITIEFKVFMYNQQTFDDYQFHMK